VNLLSYHASGWDNQNCGCIVKWIFFSPESLSIRCGVWSPVTVEASGVYVLLKTTSSELITNDD
jgi:hypothetical protein